MRRRLMILIFLLLLLVACQGEENVAEVVETSEPDFAETAVSRFPKY